MSRRVSIAEARLCDILKLFHGFDTEWSLNWRKSSAFAVVRHDCYQRWNPRGRPWPRGHILKSLALASKPQVFENVLSSAREQHYFLNVENFVDRLKNVFLDRFFGD